MLDSDLTNYINYLEDRSTPLSEDTVRNILLFAIASSLGESSLVSTLTWLTPVQGTVETNAVDILLPDSDRKALMLKPNGKLWINIGADASNSFSLFELNAGDTLFLDSGVAQRISAIAETANTIYTLRVAT